MRRGSNTATPSSRSTSYTRRYRTRGPTSRVDETLFGSTTPESSQRNQETIQIITKDLVRNVRIPRIKDPTRESIVLPGCEIQRITSESRVVSKEEKEAQREAYRRKMEEEIKAAEEMRHQIFEADRSLKEKQPLTDLELEAQASNKCLLEQAEALRMEQEDEIKMLNKLILNAQCQATVDAQIKEKQLIQTELLEEERRLDAMMEVDRRKALETEEQIDELRKQQRISGMQQIYNDIQRRLEDKKIQEEMKEYEKQQIREKQEKINLEDLKALEKKREEQQRLQEEIMHINAEAIRAKEQRKEEEKLADLRDMEYIKKKLEREAEYEAEQRRIKKEKEMEIARLRAQQERAKDYKAEQDELHARRNQDISNREWRRKEKELAEKKAKEEAMLKEARLEQIRCKEHFLSIEAGRQKAEFERVLKVQQDAIIKQKEEEEKQRRKALQHAEAIRRQVKEREVSAIAKRREVLKEADRLMEEARQRRIRLNEIKEKKLQELKATGLSEHYCNEVERKARACIH